MTVAVSVLAFNLHPVAWAVLLVATAMYAVAIRNPAFAVNQRQAWAFLGAVGVLLVALTWPVADLAAHHLLVALVVQRLLLLLAAPPLLLLGVPTALVVRATRPPLIDEAVRFCSRPVPAIALVTVTAIATLTTPAVDGQASSAVVRALLNITLLGAGIVLWLPVLRPLPGSPAMTALGRAGYLVVQSIVPSFLAVVWIFARHPLYAVYAHAGRTFGMSPLLDQQVAGFVAKLTTIFVLWSVAFVIVHRAEARPDDDMPLTWADVERHLERIDRRARRRAALPLPPIRGEPAGGGSGSGRQGGATGERPSTHGGGGSDTRPDTRPDEHSDNRPDEPGPG